MEEFRFSKNLPLAKLVIIQERLAELIAEKKESKLYYIPSLPNGIHFVARESSTQDSVDPRFTTLDIHFTFTAGLDETTKAFIKAENHVWIEIDETRRGNGTSVSPYSVHAIYHER
eukprot:Colp12_sorted_trinity150504_noHs@2319